MNKPLITRNGFLRLAALGLGGLAMLPLKRTPLTAMATLLGLVDFPKSELLGRVCQGKQELKARPDPDSSTLGVIYEDAVVPWLREVVSQKPVYIFNNQKWVETPDGFIYGALLQPVRNQPNQPVTDFPKTSLGSGMWMEVTVPYVDVVMENKPSTNSWVEAKVDEGQPVRFYYSQVFWVDKIKKTAQNQVLYRVNPNYYGGVDLLWAPAEAFRPIRAEELSPIHPDAVDKRIVVDLTYQTLSCFEGKQEVYFCRVSTGAKFDMYGNVVNKWATPVGNHRVARKFISLQMSGGTTGAGYDLPGIGWTTIFVTGGVAIHSTFWHNNFGDMMSHGCVNTRPEDAKWIFRWTLPTVPSDPGMLDVGVLHVDSTQVQVKES
jgi:lipoprotein-anchoring transpeptidase ErfK/SrfK